nr:DUF2878 family protein [Burkholderia multivorans]
MDAQLNVVLRWLTAALLGAVAGALSFRAGAALGAVHFASPAACCCSRVAGRCRCPWPSGWVVAWTAR